MDCDDVRMKIVKYLDFSWKIPDIYTAHQCQNPSMQRRVLQDLTTIESIKFKTKNIEVL